MIELNDQEQQLIEIPRQSQEVAANFHLEVERVDGAWIVTLIEVGTNLAGRGTGETFAQAWDNVDRTWDQGRIGR